MVNFGSIPASFSHSDILGTCTGPSMFVLYHFLFYLYIQNAEAYMGKARMLRKNCTQRQNENEKRTKTMGNSEPSQIVLARTRQRLGRWSFWMNLGIPVIVDWQRRARPLLLLRSSSSVLMYLRYPRRGLNVYHNPVATTTMRLKLFLHNVLSNRPATGVVTILSRLGQTRAIACFTASPAETVRRAQNCIACSNSDIVV